MSAEMTVVGNLTTAPELRYTSSGTPVASFTVADTPRIKDGNGGWKDGETLFQRCEVWRELAEHVAQSLDKGDRLIARGRVKANVWTGKDGQERREAVMDVDAVGPELRWATATVQRVRRSSGSTTTDLQWDAAGDLVVGETTSHKTSTVGRGADGLSGSTVITSAKHEFTAES